MEKKLIQLQHLNNKMLEYNILNKVVIPTVGWIKAIRTTLGMSMLQLGNKLNISKQAVLDIEKREKDGAITLKSLKEVANALDMELVYGFVPKDGSLEALIERKARELATQIVMRSSITMILEDQGNSPSRVQTAIEERTVSIKNEMPKILWD